MKIAILVPLFLPRWVGGTEIATHNLARHLSKRGHEVHVITSLDPGLPKKSLEQGFHVHRIGVSRVRFLGVMLFWLQVLRELLRLRPDLVHSQSIRMGIPAFLAKKLAKTPYVVWGRGTDVYLPWSYKRLISKLALKNPDTVIALTEDMKLEMQRMCGRGVHVIPNGIDLQSLEGLPAKAAIREELGLGCDETIILFVGTLRAVKGVKYLMEAMSMIRQKCGKARLVLVGDGEERQSLETLVRELALGASISFAGRVSNEMVSRYMIASDILVLPSLSEGFPNAVLEAMAVGLPVVTSRVGGLAEIIEEGQNGFLVEPGNAGQIADRVLTLLGDDELRARIC